MIGLRVALVFLCEAGKSEDCDYEEKDDDEESADAAAELLAHLVPVVDVHTSEGSEHAEHNWLCTCRIFVIHGGCKEIAADANSKPEEDHAETTQLSLDHEACEELRKTVNNDLCKALVDVKRQKYTPNFNIILYLVRHTHAPCV